MRERKMTEAQRAYEARRAAKAGMSLEKWLKEKERRAAAAAQTASAQPPQRQAETKKKPGLISRLLEKATKPL